MVWIHGGRQMNNNGALTSQMLIRKIIGGEFGTKRAQNDPQLVDLGNDQILIVSKASNGKSLMFSVERYEVLKEATVVRQIEPAPGEKALVLGFNALKAYLEKHDGNLLKAKPREFPEATDYRPGPFSHKIVNRCSAEPL